MATRQRGFTLIEVLVAMAIFGIVALTLLTHNRDQVRQAASLEDRLLAHWVALNTLTELQTGNSFPDLGKAETSAVMAGRDWFVDYQVQPTPVNDVRNVRIDVSAYDVVSEQKGNVLVSLTGFVGRRGGAGN
ncbi:type II secretion system minor pseudopilin GspI [Perlucidibaca piscinae]|uniref:type II secretion system minor pseudopilin GspI n=1 Tax=Perlucidibaca piscinae TaxID=392589 RepID=UPI0003B4AC14|nr:type II secretion system minor pseudopilin GspI [Perlucidibaca piscinae]